MNAGMGSGFWHCRARSDILPAKNKKRGGQMLKRVLQAAIVVLAGTTGLAAQTAYPSHTITMIVAFAAGGSTDLIVGLLSNEVNSWMTGYNTNVDGKQTRIVARYSGSAPAYRARCDEVAANHYRELALA